MKIRITADGFNSKELSVAKLGAFRFCVTDNKRVPLAAEYLRRVQAFGDKDTESVERLTTGNAASVLRCVLAIAAHDKQVKLCDCTAAHIRATEGKRADTDAKTETARLAATAKSAALRKLRAACEMFAASHDGVSVSRDAKDVDFVNFALAVAFFPSVVPDGMTAAEKLEALKSAAFATNGNAPDIALAALDFLNAVEECDNARAELKRARDCEILACERYLLREQELIRAVKLAQELASNPDATDDDRAKLEAARADLAAFRESDAE